MGGGGLAGETEFVLAALGWLCGGGGGGGGCITLHLGGGGGFGGGALSLLLQCDGLLPADVDLLGSAEQEGVRTRAGYKHKKEIVKT